MFTAKPKLLSLSLIFYATLALVLATGSNAYEYDPAHIYRREHFNHHRLIRKRAPPESIVSGTQTGPTAVNTQTVTAPVVSNTPAQPTRTQASSNAVSVST